MGKVCGVILILFGLALGGWIAYNLLVEMQPEARGRDPFLPIVLSLSLVTLGVRLFRGGPRIPPVKGNGPRALVCLALLSLSAWPHAAHAGVRKRRPHAVTGIIYVTNDSQPDEAVRVELLTRDRKRALASKHPSDMTFSFGGLRPALYVLRLRWYDCVLDYEVDARRRRATSVRIIMDAACANERYRPGEVRPQPPPAPPL